MSTRLFGALCLLACSSALAQPAIELASYDFEGSGGPDAQGWLPYHRGQSDEIYFHVEDFAGAGHSVSALTGQQSLWCGVTAEDPRACSTHAPGYGNSWSQNFVSREFAVSGDVTIEFLMRVANEAGYDYAFVQYEDAAGDWITLDTWNCSFAGCGPQLYDYVVPAAAHDGTIRFRFWFTSDGAFSSLDGFFPNHDALVVDDLRISDVSGVLGFEDFESEAVGALATLSGDWYAEANHDVPLDGQLVDGSATLQVGATVNSSHLWAFTASSSEDFGCAGHPEQAATPDVMNAIVRSPFIALSMDADGHSIDGPADSLLLEFDVYRDLDGVKRYTYSIRYYDAANCFVGASYANKRRSEQAWHHHRMSSIPPAEATQLRIELGTNNYDYSGNYCTTHAPLFDDVRVKRFGGVVTASPRATASILTLRQNHPNPFNPRTQIEFELATPAVAALRVYDVAGRLVCTLRDGPLAAGAQSVTWNGDDAAGRPVSSGVYFYELRSAEERLRRRMVLLR